MDEQISPILQESLPDGQAERAAARLPSMLPVEGAWLQMDSAYGAQMQERRRLMAQRAADVYAQLPEGVAAARACLAEVLSALPAGFERAGDWVECPDGHRQRLDWDAPLWSLGAIVQQDVCILEKQTHEQAHEQTHENGGEHGGEHVLTGAMLCFPASWTLAQKIGKPLIGIHRPVTEYDDGIAARVQRLFDGVQVKRPLWRANHLSYDDPTLFQPRTENDPRPVGTVNAGYIRSERQTVLRLTSADAVAFVIHTSVVAAD